MTEIGNPELLVYCLWRMSAIGKYVEIEDIFAELFHIAPSRFSWRTRALPSDKIGDQALRDAKKKYGDGLILASKTRAGLQLTAEGVAWVRDRLSEFEAIVEEGAPAGPARPSQRALVALENHPLVQAYASGENLELSRLQLAPLLRLTPDADGRAWKERIESYKSNAQLASRDVVLKFLRRLEAEHADWVEVVR